MANKPLEFLGAVVLIPSRPCAVNYAPGHVLAGRDCNQIIGRQRRYDNITCTNAYITSLIASRWTSSTVEVMLQQLRVSLKRELNSADGLVE